MQRLRSALLVVALVALPWSRSAQAQWSPDATLDLGMGYGQMALSQSALSGTRAIGSTSGKAFSARPRPEAKVAAPVRGTLVFQSTPGVTQVVNRRFIDWQSERHPQLRAELAAGIEDGSLQRYFQTILANYDYARNNLADVSAAYYISLWKIIHGRDLTPGQIAGVRRQMRTFMARDSRLTQLPDAQKQEICETFALHTALALQGYEQLVQTGDAKTLASFRRGLQAKLAPQGPDLAAIGVTDDGFVTSP
jgi:hypothetical protein